MPGEILGVVLATVGAGLGGLLGASVAFRKHRRQRAFDLRAEWYADIVKALMHQHGLLILSTLEIQQATKDGTETSEQVATAALASVDFLHGDLLELLQQAPLYASKDGAVRLQEVGDMSAFVSNPPTSDPDWILSFSAELFTYAKTLKRVAVELSNEFREQLGEAPLDVELFFVGGDQSQLGPARS